jgi:integrase
VANLFREAQSLAFAGVAVNTMRVYSLAYHHFREFCNLYDIGACTTPILLQCFATWLHLKQLSPATIRTYVAAVKFWEQLLQGRDIPHTFALTKTLKGIARQVPQLPDDRQPITLPYLAAIVSALPLFMPPYYCLLYKSMFTLAFYAMLRVSEMTKTRFADHNLQAWAVTLLPSAVTLRLQSSKTSHKNEPEQLVTVPAQPIMCPLAALQEYVASRPPAFYLFVNVSGDPVTYDQFSAAFQRACYLSQLPYKKLTTHSFRIGGASYYSSIGCSDQQVKLLGRWASDAYRKYVRTFQ